jgi:UDP-glucose 4-epimerase
MKILITGATGFIGNHLVRHLQPNYEIIALRRKRLPEHDLLKMQWIEQDLAKAIDYSCLPQQVDTIIHLAQSKLYRQFPDGAQDIFDINIRTTFRLLEYARHARVKCFIFASSGGMYGYSYEKFVETDPVNPLNFYLSSKYTAELLIANYNQFFRTIVFRLFFVYGPGQQGMLISNLLHKVLCSEKIVVEGNPGLRINPIYIDDVIRAFEPTLRLSRSDLFNVAGDEIVTITDLVKLIEEATGKRALVSHTDVNPGGDLVGDNTRMKEVMGVYPKTPLIAGLRLMLSN